MKKAAEQKSARRRGAVHMGGGMEQGSGKNPLNFGAQLGH